MALVRWSPTTTSLTWDPFREMERMVRSFFPELRSLTDTWTEFAPALDMYEKPEALCIEVDLPGLTKDEVQVRIENGVLYIQGERKAPQGVSHDRYYCHERWSGSFYRAVTLPDFVDTQAVTAEFQNGVLRIVLPKKPEARPIEVTIH